MRTITRDGVALAYDERGAGEPAILLLHGMACVHQHMAPLVDALASDHRCLSFDLRGHGASGVPHGAYSAGDFTADIGFAIDELDLDRPILIGHSFGGSISLIFARAYPERVRGLVMLDSGLRSRATIGADLNPFYDALRAATPEQYRVIVEEFCMTRLFDPVDDQVVAREISQQMAQVPAHVFLSMAQTVTSFDSADTARACTVPSLIIQSCQPFVDPVELATLPSNWHEGRVVGAGHFIQLLAPDQVIPMVRRFLELATRRRPSRRR